MNEFIKQFNFNIKADRARFYRSRQWRAKRQEILKRDNYECLHCKRDGRVTTINDAVLEIDHIQELEKAPELALTDDNLRTLCRDCHNKRHKKVNYKPSKRKKKWDDELDIL